MVTRYPASIDNGTSLPLLVGSSVLSPNSVNILRDAIIAIETELGVKPSGLYDTVRSRLDAIDVLLSGVQGNITFGGDLSGTMASQTVVGIRSRPVSAVAPAAGQTLIFSGATYIPGTNFGSQNITTSGGITAGPAILGSIDTSLFTLNGIQVFNGVGVPSISDLGQAILYYDSGTDKLKVSENGSAYVNLLTADAITWATDLAGSTLSSQIVVSLTGLSGIITALANTIQFGTSISTGTIGTNKSGASLVLQAGIASTVLTATSSLVEIAPSVRLDNLAGNGAGFVAVNNSGTLSFSTGFDNVTPTTISYGVLATDQIIAVGSISGSITITLLASPSLGQVFTIKDEAGSSSTYPIIIDGNGHNIDGAATISLNNNYGAITLTYTGSQWSIL